jgi:hypothetical protein
MCTVSFVPGNNCVYFTSNRDEKHLRKAAIPPAIYPAKSGNMLFPRDGEAGGTWIAAHDDGRAIVFLNGAWQPHIPQPPYRRSRGLILLDLMDASSAGAMFDRILLDAIEPFTAVVWEQGALWEFRWDGREKYVRSFSADQPRIWSSVTLYPEPVIQKRNAWFNSWLQEHPVPNRQAITDFHRFGGEGDLHNDIRMNREGALYTVSITSLELSASMASMRYIDFKADAQYEAQLSLTSKPVSS